MDFLLNLLIVICFVFLSGLTAGLLLGLMSLSPIDLKRKAKLGDIAAAKIYPLRKESNRLLSTLTIANVAVNSGLSIFLGNLTSGLIAGMIATVLIVVFGDILPQSMFSKHALRFSANVSWFIKLMMFILYPVAKPISLILDRFLGEELINAFSKKELVLLLDDHRKLRKLDEDEFEILKGGLAFSDKSVKDIMTPWFKTFFVEHDAVLDKHMLRKLKHEGYTRIPVFDRKKRHIIGLLLVKDLLGIDFKKELPVKKMMRVGVIQVNNDEKLDNVLNMFRKKRIHLFIVVDKDKTPLGILTLEDILEEIVGEIIDESDIGEK